MSSRPSPRATPRWLRRAAPVAALVVVAGIVLATRPDGGAGPQTNDAPSLAVVDVAAQDTISVGSVDDLLAAAACVARGRVTGVARGRTVGTVDAPVVTRLVALDDVEVVAGRCPAELVVEQEGWIADGRAITVNGWPIPEAGDEGLWFLALPRDEVQPYAVTVATTGALLWRNGRPLLPEAPAAWVRAATGNGIEELAMRVARDDG